MGPGDEYVRLSLLYGTACATNWYTFSEILVFCYYCPIFSAVSQFCASCSPSLWHFQFAGNCLWDSGRMQIIHKRHRRIANFSVKFTGVRRVHSVWYNGYERKEGKRGTESLQELTVQWFLQAWCTLHHTIASNLHMIACDRCTINWDCCYSGTIICNCCKTVGQVCTIVWPQWGFFMFYCAIYFCDDCTRVVRWLYGCLRPQDHKLCGRSCLNYLITYDQRGCRF